MNRDAIASRFLIDGQVWREYDLAPYTTRIPAIARPEQAVVDWILRRTGIENWHGETVSVLAASRGKLRVLHTPELQDQVEQIVERFVRPVQPDATLRVEMLAYENLEWRNGLVHLLHPIASGPEGQMVWLLPPEDIALIRERLRMDPRARSLSQKSVRAINGVEAAIDTGQAVNYISGLELTTGAYLAYQPVVGRLQEGIRLAVTPVWAPDGSAVDLELKLSTQVVTKLHDVHGTAPLSTGNQIAAVQVPQVASTSLAQDVRWPTSHVLLISAGVQTGLLGPRRGLLGRAGQAAELLVLMEIDPPISLQVEGERRRARR